jgi:hypothetical protein
MTKNYIADLCECPPCADSVEEPLSKPSAIADSLSVLAEAESMMGPQQTDQAALFYAFSLERHVPATHFLRAIDGFHLNLAYCWFCRLGLDGDVPDHSTFSKNRHGRFRDCDLLRKPFETVVRRCVAEGLLDGTAFAVDANKQRLVAGADQHDWESLARTRRSVREYLDMLDEAA